MTRAKLGRWIYLVSLIVLVPGLGRRLIAMRERKRAHREKRMLHLLALRLFAKPSLRSPHVAIIPKCVAIPMDHPSAHSNHGAALEALSADDRTLRGHDTLQGQSERWVYPAGFSDAGI